MIGYLIDGFGYKGWGDFKRTIGGSYFNGDHTKIKVLITALLGFLRMVLNDYVGLDTPVFFAFVFLVYAEFYTGVKVARKVRNEKFKSRKMGRMFLKIGVYISMLAIIHAFAVSIKVPELMGIPLNPFVWLYYTVFIAVVFQLFISWMENLGSLGYKETKGLAGFILRKLNKWFEVDGSKNNYESEEEV